MKNLDGETPVPETSGGREQVLQEAFLSFQSASESLVSSYAALERRISDLSEALTQKNRDFDRQGTFLEALLGSLSAGVAVLTPGGTVLYRNPAMDPFLDPDDPGFLSFLAENGLWPPGLPQVERAIDHGGRSFVVVRRPVDGPAGPIGFVFIATDVTKSREMEAEIARDRRLKAMGEMVAQIAHELRNPLGSLELFNALLTRDAATPEAREFLNHMATSIASMDRLVDNLLYHTRPPEMQESLVLSTTLMERMAGDFSRMVRSSGRSRPESRLRFVGQDNPPRVALRIDEHLVYHALFNLVTNAVEAVSGELSGEVLLGARIGTGGDFVFFVEDNGPGIAKESEERIFDPFYTTRAKGTGLGLSIVHNVAAAHGGEVHYSREQDRTRFFLSIPAGRTGRPETFREDGGGTR